MQGKKFVASYSGGKDSVLALYRAVKMGMEPVGLLITYHTEEGRSWFHGVPEKVLERAAASLNIPVFRIETNGPDYEDRFREELERQKKRGAEVCVFGDIDIQGHLEWDENICKPSGIQPFFPLWQEKREKLVREFIFLGFTAHISVVDTDRLSENHLGKVLSEEEMLLIAQEGADVCGENGEYHTFVSDGPLFQTPVQFTFGEKQVWNHHACFPILP